MTTTFVLVRALLLLCAFLLGVGEANGQVVHIAGDRPACTDCVIHMERRVSLGSVDGPGYIGQTITLPRDSRGRYYVSSGAFVGEVKMYDSTGMFIGHLARRGHGPGEVVSAPRMTVTADDSVHVFDVSRYSVFSQDGAFSRSEPLSFAVYYAVPVAEGFVIAATVPSTRDFTATLHTMDRTARVVRSFARETGNVSAAHRYVLDRQIGPGVNGTVWSATTFGEYTLQRWRPDGTLVSTVIREPAWFDPNGKYAFGAWRPGASKPPPVLQAVRQASDGLLWVVASVADANWQSAGGRATSEQMFDSVIEILDVERGALISSRRVDQFMMGFVGPDLFSYGEGPAGSPEVVVWKVQLVRN